MATYSDDFNRASLGSSWTSITGNLEIVSSYALWHGNSTSSAGHYASPMDGADQYVEADALISGGGSSGIEVNLLLRAQGGTTQTYYRGVYYNASASRFYEIRRVVGGSSTTLVSETASAVGSLLLRFEVEGDDLRLYHDGTLVASATDSTITSGDYAGVLLRDHYLVNLTRVDSFECGDLDVGVAVKPEAATASASAPTPTIALSPLSLSAPAATAAATAITAGLLLGITPPRAEATAQAHAPTVAVSAVEVAPPAATATGQGRAPVVTVGGLILAPGTATATGQAHTPSIQLGALTLAPDAATATADGHVPAVSVVTGALVAPPTATATAAAALPYISGIDYPATSTPARFPSPVLGSVTPALLPATAPARINEWPITVLAHPMPALTPTNKRVRPWLDYTPLRGVAGRLHIWVDGVDVTFLRDHPAIIDDWSSSDPLTDDAARFTMRQIAEGDELGTGDLTPFALDRDPTVDIALLDESGNLTHLWDGHIAREADNSGTNTGRVFLCEGSIMAAAHAPHMPPTIMDETDIGIVIPRVLNGTPGRRFHPIAEVITGITTSKRGHQGQTRLEYVEEILATAYTETGIQWTLTKIGPRRPALVLKDETGWDAKIIKGAHGIDARLVKDQTMRWDGLFGEGAAPNGGQWGNWFFPGLDLFIPPPYPYTDTNQTITVGDTDAGTDTGDGVTLVQQRLAALGYPSTVTGTYNSTDAANVLHLQNTNGLLADGIVGPQTWTSMFTPSLKEIDLQAVRLPLASKDWVLPNVYAANGAVLDENPLHDPDPIPKTPNIKFGADITKTDATELARRMLLANGDAAWTGSLTLTSDPVDPSGVPFSRLLLREGHRILVEGHDGGTIVRVADASRDDATVALQVDEKNRDALTLDAIRERDMEARQELNPRPGSPRKISSLTRDHIVQFEEESKAGQIPAYPVNGNVGLWSVFPIVVSQTGRIAKLDMQTRDDVTTFVVAFFGKPIEPQRLASMVPNPIIDGDGWREHEETLILDHAWIETFGSPGSLAGYSPWQQSDGRAVTGALRDWSGLEFTSERRGYLWVAVFSSASTIVSGRAYPAVPQ